MGQVLVLELMFPEIVFRKIKIQDRMHRIEKKNRKIVFCKFAVLVLVQCKAKLQRYLKFFFSKLAEI